MPCYDPRVDEDNRENRVKVQKLTRLLCESMKLHESCGTSRSNFSQELWDWWRDHQKVDEKRKEREKKGKNKFLRVK
jgi:hypothetical protein